jgi:ribosomal protein L11 methyltransferase
MNYYELTFAYQSAIEKEIINDVLAATLGEIGFESFTECETGLTAFVPAKSYSEEALNTVIQQFPLDSVEITYTIQLIEGQDWNEEWEKNYFKPIRIKDECLIRASFHATEAVKYDIVIDPKMAFGTGNHETTFLMISEMLKLNLEGKTLLDMGCGTAVLAILAAMKGAGKVVAIDIDEWAYANALDNIKMNNTPQIEVGLGGAEQLETQGSFEVIFANINRNILLNDIHLYAAHLKEGGVLYMSGFYTEDIPVITEECSKHNLRFVSNTEKNNWVAVQFVK